MGEICVDHLGKVYAVPGQPRFEALRDISFTWHQGECLALIGESGSGKSTVGRMLIGLEKPTSGSVLLCGEHTEVWNQRMWRAHRGEIQAVFQDTSGTLNPRLSVRRNAMSAMRNLTRMNRQEREERIHEMFRLIHLNERLLRTPVSALSGGEQRRIALIRALSIRPSFLILDEVTAGLDSINAGRVSDAVQTCLEVYSCGCLLISHDMQVVDRLADRVIELSHGRISGRAARNRKGEDA